MVATYALGAVAVALGVRVTAARTLGRCISTVKDFGSPQQQWLQISVEASRAAGSSVVKVSVLLLLH